jgi:hypothetical protein
MRFVVALCMLMVMLVPSTPAPVDAQEGSADPVINVELILDVSGSMAQVIDTGETRMDAAKRVIREVVAAIPEQEGINVGLRIYGFAGDNTDAGQAESCASSELVVPIDGVDKETILQKVDALQPTGWTPLGESLARAGEDFAPGENVTNAAVLITDGLETCGGDPCSTAGELHAAEINLITHVVGFGLVPEEQETLGCIAENGGGMLLGAANATELSSALFDILEDLEVVQGVGFIGGNALGSLPEGEPGELSVLAIGPYDGNVLPIVIRNNTGQDIIRVTAVATARNPAGQVIASGNDQLFSPNLVRSGGVAFGYAYFGGIELAADTTFEVDLDAKPATDDEFENRRDLEIVEASTVDGRVVGTMQNIYDAELTGPISVDAVCFDEAGDLVAHLKSYTNKETVAPEESASFQVDNFLGVPCPLFLVAASGWDDTFSSNNSVEPPGTPLVTATETPDSGAAQSPASTPVTDAAGCVDLTSAESVLLALQAAGLPVGDYIVYDAATDPNELLGRPGQYIGKVNFVDTSIGEVTPDFSLSEGGSIEVFETEQAAQIRHDYILTVTQSSPLLAEYDFLEGTVLLRLSKSFTPDEAAVYEQALIAIVSCGAAT